MERPNNSAAGPAAPVAKRANARAVSRPKKVLITQSNYIPWKGYFDAINKVDLIVLYDEMQYTRRDWRNRNRIKTPNGLKWLTIPVRAKGNYHQKINEIEVLDSSWAGKHWKTLYHTYGKAPYFEAYTDTLEALYERAADCSLLSEVNYLFLNEICKLLGIDTQFAWSRDFELRGDKSERILHLCRDLGATDYYTGPAAKEYMDAGAFRQKGVEIHWLDFYSYPAYPQLYGDFEHGVTVLDTLFMMGPEAGSFIFSK